MFLLLLLLPRLLLLLLLLLLVVEAEVLTPSMREAHTTYFLRDTSTAGTPTTMLDRRTEP